MDVVSPFYPYMTSKFAITNPGQIRKFQGGLRYTVQVMPYLTNNSLLVVRQQMDDHNHDMVNMLTQQIGITFKLTLL